MRHRPDRLLRVAVEDLPETAAVTLVMTLTIFFVPGRQHAEELWTRTAREIERPRKHQRFGLGMRGAHPHEQVFDPRKEAAGASGQYRPPRALRQSAHTIQSNAH